MRRRKSTEQRVGSFWHVTLPAIKGISVVLCLLMTIWTVNDFDTPWLLNQGGPANATENLVVLAYRYTFARNDVGMGATVFLRHAGDTPDDFCRGAPTAKGETLMAGSSFKPALGTDRCRRR